ncbi:MAG: Ig-like domain-containing protein [Patescibacteria group bacterium]
MGLRAQLLKRVVAASLALVFLVPSLAAAVDITVNATIADTTPPSTIIIDQPVTGTTYTPATIPTIFSGTGGDTTTGVGLSANSIQLTLQRQSDGLYWDGANWVAGPVFLGTNHPATTQGTIANWTSSFTMPPWLDDTYTVIARAVDRAGNVASSSSVTFTINTPVVGLIAITNPTTNTTYSSNTIPVSFTGTLRDASSGTGFQPNSAEFYIQRESDGSYWNGNNWIPTVFYLSTTHSGTNDGTQVNWTSNALLPPWLDGSYLMQARATNRSNILFSSAIIRFTIANGAAAAPGVVSPPPSTTPPTFFTPPSFIPTDTPFGWITSLPGADLMSRLLALATLLLTIGLALIPALLQLPLRLPATIGPLANLFAQFIAWLHRRRRYGIVYDSANSKPVEGAFVRLIAEGGNQFEVGKLLESKKTDDKGRYSFDVREGLYRVEVIMPNYAFPSSRATIGYLGEILEATDQGLVYPDVPIDSLTPNAHQSILRFRELGIRIQQLRIPLSITGTIFAISFFIERGAPIDSAILVLYVVFWFLEYLNWLQGREVAYVTADNKPVALTILRLYDTNGRLRTTKTTDLRGRYSIFAATGNYLLDVLHRAFDVQSNEIRVKQSGVIPKHIYLHQLPKTEGQ